MTLEQEIDPQEIRMKMMEKKIGYLVDRVKAMENRKAILEEKLKQKDWESKYKSKRISVKEIRNLPPLESSE